MKYVSSHVTRHGRRVYCHRVRGKRVRLKGEPGSAEFDASLEWAKNTAAATPPSAPLSVVYFLLYNNARVKIGTAKNVRARMEKLLAGVPGKCRIYYATPGDTRLERHLHDLFATDRITREWFRYSKAIRDWITADEERRQEERERNGLRCVSL